MLSLAQISSWITPLWTKVAIFLGVFLAATFIRQFVLVVGEKMLGRRLRMWPAGLSLRQHFFPSFWIFLISLGLIGVLPYLGLSAEGFSSLGLAFKCICILSATWFTSRLVTLFKVILYEYLDVSGPDNLYGRSKRTQVQFVEKLLLIIVWLAGISICLMLFESARKLGTSLMASAGLAGVVLGFAAQRSLGNLVAGLQIAFTQPIRIDDVVVVEKEWGKIEEITLTYVVVRLWDLRRLVLPITYFTERPFENWTRTSAQIIGSVFVYADYSIDVEAVRQEFHRIIQGSPLWDRQTAVFQVTHATERSVELRAIMSATDSSSAFDLRCYVRESLIAYLQKSQRPHLPKYRLDTTQGETSAQVLS